MLAILLLVSLLSQGYAVDYGTEFVTAFPENLAYYFPSTPSLRLKITTFVPNTKVVVNANNTELYNNIQSTPGVFEVPITNIDLEVSQFTACQKTITITSDKNITVLSVSKRGDSIQANMVPPTTRLGMEYLIPSLNYTEYANQVNTYVVPPLTTSAGLMDFSFRLILINAMNVDNKVLVTQKLPAGDDVVTVTLGPFEMIQLQSSSFWFKVSATAKVAVILTNPCVDSIGCRCNMISQQIRPNEFLGKEFIYPPLASLAKLFVTSAESVTLTCGSNQAQVSPGSIKLIDYFQNNADTILTTSAPSGLRVIRPGLIIDLLPMNMFASCFLVHKLTASAEAYALVIVETGKEDELQIGTTLATKTCLNIAGTSYTHCNITITQNSNVIWHPSSKIAVYNFEKLASQVFTGGPAISINDEPDPNGCVVVPMEFELSNVTLSWQASRAHCKDKGMLLASPNLNYTQIKMEAALNSINAEGVAWLGLRRSLVTSEWYWHRTVPFDFANWDNNQPSNNLCVSMRMEVNGNYTWSTERCCTPSLPLCVRDMVLLGLITDNSVMLT